MRYGSRSGELRSVKEVLRRKARSSRWKDWIGRTFATVAAVAAVTCGNLWIDNPIDNLQLTEAVELAAFTTGGAAMVNVATRSRNTSGAEQSPGRA